MKSGMNCDTVEPRLSEIKERTRFWISKILDNSEIPLDVIRCNKNNTYSETRLMLIKFTAQQSVRYLQIQSAHVNF
jgi:hypothetical protein